MQQAVCSPPHPSWLSQNQTVKCTLLLSINREATLTKNTVVEGSRDQEKQTTILKKKELGKERARKRNRKRTRGDRGRFWKVLHLAAWNVESKRSATGVKANSSVTVKVITKSATEFML